MEWRDTGILLSVRNHGETSVIAEVFTAKHGRHAGVVRGGISRKLKPVLQPGAQLSLTWTARLESHLGSFKVELERSRAADIMASRLGLEAANTICALISMSLPEREAMPHLYAATVAIFDRLGDGPDWISDYVRWETALLSELGFGLDLNACAATGVTQDLVYVSPRSGRAVSASAGAPYAEKLLKLPGFLRLRGANGSPAEVAQGIAMTGYFLANRVARALGRETLPGARGRLEDLLRRQVKDGLED